MLDDVLGNDASIKGFKLGTHTLRKTAYLFAVFGIMLKYEVTGRRVTTGKPTLDYIQSLEDDALAKAGRHVSMKNASLYYMSALEKWHTAGVHHDRAWRTNKVSEWKSIYAGTKTCPPNQDAVSQTDKTLAELAPWYVRHELNITPTHNNFQRTITVACHKPPNRSCCDDLKRLLNALPPQLKVNAHKLLREALDQAHRDALNGIGRDVRQRQQAVVVVGQTGCTSTTGMSHSASNSPAAGSFSATTTAEAVTGRSDDTSGDAGTGTATMDTSTITAKKGEQERAGAASSITNTTTMAAATERTSAPSVEEGQDHRASTTMEGTTATTLSTAQHVLAMPTSTNTVHVMAQRPTVMQVVAAARPSEAIDDPIEMERMAKAAKNKRKRKQRGDNPDDYEDKINAMDKCRSDKDKDRKKLYELCVEASTLRTIKITEKSQSWVQRIKRSKTKIDWCVQNHHGGDLNSFLAMGGMFSTSSYKCACPERK